MKKNSLDKLPLNENGYIIDLKSDGALRRRMLDLGLVKSHDWTTLTQELTDIHKAVKDAGELREDKTLPPVKDKLIIETCFLTDEEIKRDHAIAVSVASLYLPSALS